MRMHILKIVVVLIVAGSGDARPQNDGGTQVSVAGPEVAEGISGGWKPIERMDAKQLPESRYTRNSGNSRKSYISYYRDRVSPLIPRSSEKRLDALVSGTSLKESTRVFNSSIGNDTGRGPGSDFTKKIIPLSFLGKEIDQDSGESFTWVGESSRSRGISNPQGSSVSNYAGHSRVESRSFDEDTGRSIRNASSSWDLAVDQWRPMSPTKNWVPLENARGEVVNNSGVFNSYFESKRQTTGTSLTLNQNSGTNETLARSFAHSLNGAVKNGVGTVRRGTVKVRHGGPVAPSNRFTRVGGNGGVEDAFKDSKAARLVVKEVTKRYYDHTGAKDSLRRSGAKNRTRGQVSFKRANKTRTRYPNSTRKPIVIRENDKVSGKKKIGKPIRHGKPQVPGPYLKNWPNGAFQNVQDLYNYEKYTSFQDNFNKASSSHDSHQVPGSILQDSSLDDPLVNSSVHKIIHWLKLPDVDPDQSSLFGNYESFLSSTTTISPIYENLEPNLAASQVPNQGAANYDVLNDRPVYKPVSQVMQSTIVHILNDGTKRPNVTVTELKVPQSSSKPVNSSSAFSRPNVHIMFMSDKDQVKEPTNQESQVIQDPPLGQNCPTIMINSYTRINNTVQSKEGCTDLNIVINSHVLSTNVFTPPGEGHQVVSSEDPNETDKNVEQDEQDLYSSASYASPSSGLYGPTSLDPYQSPQSSDYFSQDPQGFQNDELSSEISPEVSSVEIFQGTQISVSALSSQEAFPEVSAEAPPVASDSSGVPIPPEGMNDLSGAQSSGPSSVSSSGLSSPGQVVGQSNNGPGSSSLQLPNLSGAGSRPTSFFSGAGSRPSVRPGLGSSSSHKPNKGEEDEEEDFLDHFDLLPSEVMKSVASVFTYFTFLNPFNYGIFSLVAAPFAAMTAGLFGVAAFMFPWAFPRFFDFGRAANKVTIRFRPNIEEVVRNSVHRYDRLNEWKSRRKKTKR